jgi:tetratricopeptide (TPR) repeat protein
MKQETLKKDAGEQVDSSAPTRETLQARVRALAAAGRCEDARHAAETDGDPMKRAMLMGMATRVCFEIGRQEDGESLLHDTMGAIHAIHDGADRTRAFVALAKGLIAGGRLSLVIEVVNQIEDQVARTETLAALAQAHFEAGEDDRAVAIARAIPEDRRMARLFAALVRKRLKAGQLEQAINTAGFVAEPYIKGSLLIEIARVCAENGLHERARMVLAQALRGAAVMQKPARVELLVAIATTFLSSGSGEQALASAQQIEDLQARSSVLAALAKKSLEKGQLNQAERFTEVMTDPALRDEAFTNLADHYLARGNYDQAFAAAERITEPDQRTAVATKIARSELTLTMKAAEPEPPALQAPTQSREYRQDDQNANNDEIAAARRYAKRGQRTRVSKLLALKNSSVDKAVLLVEIARDYAVAGKPALAEEAFRSALQETMNLFQGAEKEEALVRIGRLYAESSLIPDEKTRILLRAIIKGA